MQKQHNNRFLDLVAHCKQQIKETDVAAVHRRQIQQDKFYLVDVREDNEWAQGHLPGALHLSKGIIERDIEKTIPDSHAEILLYCGGGYRSAIATASLQQMGYSNVTSIDGGYSKWVAEGFPIEK